MKRKEELYRNRTDYPGLRRYYLFDDPENDAYAPDFALSA
jgi:hypothetical protein